MSPYSHHPSFYKKSGHRRHERMTSIDELTADYLKHHEIHGVVFDLDDTLVPEYAGVMENRMLEQIKRIARTGVQIALVTNNFSRLYCQRIINQLHKAEIDILIIENAFKPYPFSLNVIQKAFDLKPEQIVLVGDGILTDHLGALIAGYHFIPARWFPRPFYKHPVLFTLRELAVIVFDWFRFLLFRHRPHLTWLLADKDEVETARRKFLVLVNPDSSQTDVTKIKSWVREIFNGATDSCYIHIVRNIPDIHRQFAHTLQQGSFTNVIVAGGDGTVREAITLIADNNPEVTLGIIPTGTGNLLAKALNIPLDPHEALRVACSGGVESVSITRVNKTYATLLAGMGVDAEVMAQTSTAQKKKWGPLAYVFSAINVAFTKQKSIFWISLDGKPPMLRRADGVLVVQRNQFGRAFLPVDIAGDDHTSELDVCILKSSHWLDVLSVITNVFRGQYDTPAESLEHYTCRRAQVSSFPAQKIQVDGDLINDTRIDARVLENHLLIAVPMKVEVEVTTTPPFETPEASTEARPETQQVTMG